MIPLNDTEPNRYSRIPTITIVIICVNVLVFLAQILIVDDYDVFFRLYGSIPNLILTQQGSGALSSVTSMFLHGGLMHLIGNMSALWVFGRRVEDACGSGRFLLFYLTCGLSSDILSTIINARSLGPSIGACGAVFGLMGAYLLLFPNGRIRALVPLSFVPIFPKIRAYWIVFYYLALQIIPAINVAINQTDYQVGYWAHLGGFFGAIFIFLFLRPQAFARYRSDTLV